MSLIQATAQKVINADRYRPAAVIFILGFALLAVYAVGLDQNPIVHQGFHDLRHAAGFPCH